MGEPSTRLLFGRVAVVDALVSLLHISLRMTRSAWTTPDQRFCWLLRERLPALAMAMDGHVGHLGLVDRGVVIGLNADQVRMSNVSAGVVKPGGVVVTVES